MKKLIRKSIILFICLTLAMCIPSVSNASKPGKSKVKKAYENYIQRNYSNMSYTMQGLYDINKDGIQELLFAYPSGVRGAYVICTYRGQKVVKMKTVGAGGCGLYRIKGKKYIVIGTSGGAADTTFTCYRMNGKKLIKVSEYKSVSSYYGTSGVRFYKNGRQISQNEYTGYVDRLIDIRLR